MDHAVLKTGDLRQLMNELLSIEPHRRQGAVREDRYRKLALAELLAKESGQFEDRSGAEQQFRRAAVVLTGEGRLAAAFGESKDAIAGLASVRRRLLAQRRLLDAALCSLDLARLFAETGQMSRIRELIHEMHTTFPLSRDQARVLLALRDFLDAVRAGQDPNAATREALDLIRRPAAFLDRD